MQKQKYERNLTIFLDAADGVKYTQLVKKYKISRQRIDQIILSFGFRSK